MAKKHLPRWAKILIALPTSLVALALLLVLTYVLLLVTAPKERPYSGSKPVNEYVVGGGKTLVSAHRSGGGLFPEDTRMAFEECLKSADDFTVDLFEFDLHLTADDRLILLHDDTLDRTSDSEKVFGQSGVRAREKTYEELRQLNFGANFSLPQSPGTYPFRTENVPDNLRALAVEDLLDYLESQGQFRYIIEIKDGGADGQRGVDLLVEILTERDLLGRVIFGTLQNEVTAYVDAHHPELPRSAGKDEAIYFYLKSLIGWPQNEDDLHYIALQVPPTQYDYIILGTKRFVRYCHKYNLSVQYWTVNDADEIRKIADFGADVIMSDVPDTAYDVIHNR
ncbi:MAG: hypothetical protein LBN05_01090 [Oscillospiraceae bacterium]|jgi:glycerophosphoryl diester phosphodiesterase|nr:hypothetical protein [Oscillospiraceae bacterium]